MRLPKSSLYSRYCVYGIAISTTLITVITLAIPLTFIPTDDAEARQRGGRGGGGGGARASGARASGASSARVSSGATRSTVNRNVNTNRNRNVSRDVNVDVDGRYGGYGGYHPFATAAAVTAGVALTSAAIGTLAYSLPPSCSTTIVNGYTYQNCSGTWYQPQYAGSQVTYMVVNPPA